MTIDFIRKCSHVLIKCAVVEFFFIIFSMKFYILNELDHLISFFFIIIFQVQKKRRIVARVQCRNIKNECPKPTCDEPVLLPGRCCKACPGDSQSKFFFLLKCIY